MKNSYLVFFTFSILFFTFIFSCKNKDHGQVHHEEEKHTVNKDHLISFEEAKKYYQLYNQNNYALINKDRAAKKMPEDSRSYWFSISELEAYLHYVKENYPEKVDPNTLGIRVYLGTYPVGEKINGIDVGNYENVFFYPTFADKDVFKNSADSLAKNGTAKINSGENLGYNKGMLSPPN